jgi:hypothetical protein
MYMINIKVNDEEEGSLRECVSEWGKMGKQTIFSHLYFHAP